MKKNETFISTCIDYTDSGLGVVKQDGFTYFVRGLLKGEEACIKVISLKKNYGYGLVEKLLTVSENRRETICPLYPKCGGCQTMHFNKQEQAYFKENKVRNDIRYIGKLDMDVLPIITCENELKYRNKVQIPVRLKDEELIGGFYRQNSHDIIPLDECYLQSNLSNHIWQKCRELLNKYNKKDLMKHVLIKHAFATNEIMVVFVVKKKDDFSALVRELTESEESVKTVTLNINPREDNVILGNTNVVLYGNGYIVDELLGNKFRISTNSFYQVNSRQTEILYAKALEFADIQKEDIVADIYGGIGTIGICASHKAKQVYSIEIVKEATRDGRENAKLNHIDNISFECMDAKEAVTRWAKEDIHIDIAFIDPPRKGCDMDTILSLVKINPRKIVYVSCDPATLARDLKIFSENGYNVEQVQPVDMFPMTEHVETVVALSLKK